MSGSLIIKPMAEDDLASLVDLWTRCGLIRPWNDPRADITFARRSPATEILVGWHDGRLTASVMVGHDGHRGWFYYVAVDPDVAGQGLGRAVMTAAENWLRERGILKAMLMVRRDNAPVCAFYDALDYEVQDRIVYAKWLDGRPMTP